MANGIDIFASIFNGKETLVVGGALGGVVRALSLRERLWPDGVITIAVGMICAPYLSPLAVPFLSSLFSGLNLPIDQTESISAFVVGLGGMTVAGLIIDLWRARRKDANNNEPED